MCSSNCCPSVIEKKTALIGELAHLEARRDELLAGMGFLGGWAGMELAASTDERLAAQWSLLQKAAETRARSASLRDNGELIRVRMDYNQRALEALQVVVPKKAGFYGPDGSYSAHAAVLGHTAWSPIHAQHFARFRTGTARSIALATASEAGHVTPAPTASRRISKSSKRLVATASPFVFNPRTSHSKRYPCTLAIHPVAIVRRKRSNLPFPPAKFYSNSSTVHLFPSTITQQQFHSMKFNISLICLFTKFSMNTCGKNESKQFTGQF